MLHPKLLLKQFAIFWLVFMVLQLLINTTAIRSGLAGMNAFLFGHVMQSVLPDVDLKAQAIPENGKILFRFYSKAQAAQLGSPLQQTGQSANGGADTYETQMDPAYHVNTALVFLIALFIATPLAWVRRFALAGIGILFFYGFSFIRMTVRLKSEIGKLNLGLYQSDPDAVFSLPKMAAMLNALGFIFILIILIWALLVFSKKNLVQMKSHLS